MKSAIMSTMDVKKKFGKRLKSLRLERGMGVVELAKRAGITRQHLSELEHTDVRKRVTIVTIEKLAKALDVDIKEIMDFVDSE